MLRITKGVVVLLSLGGLLCQYASLNSILTDSPNNHQESYITNSKSTDTYLLSLSGLFTLPDFSAEEAPMLDPKLICPPDVSGLGCGEDLPVPISTLNDFLAAGGVHEEFCEGSFSIKSSDLGSPDDVNYCSEVYSLIRRRYTLTDDCGSSKSCLQRFLYNVDTTPPTVNCSAISDISVDCDDQNMDDKVEKWIETSTKKLLEASSDNCGDITISHNYEDSKLSSINCSSSNGVIITFIIKDACGQMVSCDANILSFVPMPELTQSRPKLTQPHDKIVSCGGSLPAPATSIEEYLAIGGLVEDPCGQGLSLSYYDIGKVESIDYCSEKSVMLRRRYTVTDGCGNKRSTIQRFEFVRDTEAPSIDCGLMNDFEIDCDKALLEGEIQDWITSMETKIMNSVSDNCGGMSISHNYKDGSASEMDCASGEKMTVSFMVSDACGNTVQCDAAILSRLLSDDEDTEDNDNSEENTDTEKDDQEESTDSEEEEDELMQIVPRPEVICITDVVDIACGDGLPPFAVTLAAFEAGGGEIVQFCGGEILISSEDIGGEINFDVCSQIKNVMRRRYIINDECGNETRCLQRFVFQEDEEAPQVDCSLANDLIIDCEADANIEDIATWLVQVKADLETASSDNCSQITISNDYEEGAAADLNCDNNNDLIVNYVIADACGNSTPCTVSIVKEDSGSSGLVIDNRLEPIRGLNLHQNRPNPFYESTSIKFELSQSSKVRLTVYDLTGKLLFEQLEEHNEGINTINITRDMLNNISGVLFYALEAKGFKEVKTLIILE